MNVRSAFGFRPAGGVPVLAVLAAVAGAGCGPGDPDRAPAPPAVGPIEPIASPAGPGAGEPNLATGPDGVYLSWLQPVQDRSAYALRFARWDGSGWHGPRTVVERAGLFVNWADFPSVSALEDGTLLAHWLQKSGPGTYAYDVRLALSRDGGDSWGSEQVPHLDGLEVEHGFVSVLPLDHAFAISWLDGRETASDGPMTLRTARVTPDGRVSGQSLIDARVCDCCQTDLAATGEGLVLAYRDRTEDEVRDIAVARFEDGEWSEGRVVHDDGWVIPGCPVNGPAIAGAGDRVVVAWFTGAPLDPDADRSEIRAAGERGRVLLAFSDDGGRTFGTPARIDDGGGMGRVSTALLDDGTALVTWMERTGEGAEVRVRAVRGTTVGPARVVSGTAAERASGFPRMVVAGSHVVFAWTEPGDPSTVRVGTAQVSTGEGGRDETT